MDPAEAFEDELRKQQAYSAELHEPKGRYEALDLRAMMNHEGHETDWLIEDVWPIGRHIHLHAQRKSQKSLVSLWCACCIAIGRDPFTGEAITPRVVAYWDFEMTEDDLRERLTDMGFTPEQLGNLHYYLMQPLPPLDTETGGRYLLEQAIAMGETVIFIDTMSRVISGDENSSDTYINFYRFTGGPLKANGIALSRLDHEGHEGGRSRGSSAKGDDVDIVWQLKSTDDGVIYIRKASRMSWVPESIILTRRESPTLSYSRSGTAWPEGTKEKALELDACDVPLEAGRTIAARMLKEGGYVAGKTLVLNAALKYRRNRMVFP